jgi:hypothetical protein
VLRLCSPPVMGAERFLAEMEIKTTASLQHPHI